MRASHGGANFLSSDTVDSAAFDISAGAPNQLVFAQSPVDCTDVTLQANADGLTGATSDAFDVTMTPDMDMDTDMDMDPNNGVACGECGQGGAVGMVPMLLMLIGMKLRFANPRRQ